MNQNGSNGPSVRYCKRCLFPETKPDLSIDADGICDACRSAAIKREIDWDAREAELKAILERYRSKDGSNYDCVIPVSGGKDSTYQVMKVLELGFRPLTVTWSACSYTDIGRHNIENMQRLGVDHIQFTPNPKVYRAIFAEAFRRVGDGCWPCHVGIFSYPIRVAVNYRIPLLIYGENPQFEYGGPASRAQNPIIDRQWLEEFGGLLGNRIEDMLGVEGITEADLIPYRYPSDEELADVGVTAIFLGYYQQWDARRQLTEVLETGFRINDSISDVEDGAPHQEGTYTNYENLDGKFVGVHDYLKFLKFGFGRATDHASIDIRNERITREEAVHLVRKYEGKLPRRYLEEYLEFVGMTEDEFYETLDAFTNKAIFKTDENGRILRDANGEVQKLVWPDDEGVVTDADIHEAAHDLTVEEMTGTNAARRRGHEHAPAGVPTSNGGPIGQFASRDE
jgi:N-acetyl sugar amidotransferase